MKFASGFHGQYAKKDKQMNNTCFWEYAEYLFFYQENVI